MAKPKNMWLVQRMDVTEDTSKPRWAEGHDVEDALEEARPRAGRGRAELEIRQQSGYGWSFTRKDIIAMAFTDEESAKAYASEQAKKNPTVPYGIFACNGVYETTNPEVITKKFTENGELVVEAKSAS